MSAEMPTRALQGVLPWTKSCFVCGEQNPRGLHLRSRVEGELVIIDYTPRETDLGYRQIVHGGIAMTMEYKVGHYFKRMTMLEQLFGDTDTHHAKVANAGATGHGNPGQSAPTAAAASAPSVSCPSAPMLNSPAWNGTATAKPVKMSGVE